MKRYGLIGLLLLLLGGPGLPGFAAYLESDYPRGAERNGPRRVPRRP